MTLLQVFLLCSLATVGSSIEIPWLSNSTWFPYKNQVVILNVEQQMVLRCPKNTNARIFLVNETGFTTCSAVASNRYSIQDFTTIVPLSPLDKHLLTCTGIGTSLTFSFKTNSQGKTLYLIDVSSLSSAPYNMTALSKEVSGGNCLSGMKLKIQIRGAPTTAPATTAHATTTTVTSLINSKTTKAVMPTAQQRATSIRTRSLAETESKRQGSTPNNSNGPDTGLQRGRAVSQACTSGILSLLLIAASCAL
jgi:hypothetical protein